MTPDQIFVTVAALLAILGVAWFFWAPRRSGVAAAMTPSGHQETTIVVKGAYNPDIIIVEHGKPVRLNFLRQETAACSERVIIPDFNRSAELPEGELVSIEFTPKAPGEYGFTCGMGMLTGKIVAV